MNPTLPTVFNGPVAVVMVIAFAIGIVNQLVKTGLFFGQYPIPQKWLPHLAIFGTFLGGLVTSLAAAPTPWTGWTFFVAFLAGGSALLAGSAPAIATAAHHTIPEQVRLMRAQRAAAKTDPNRVLGGVL